MCICRARNRGKATTNYNTITISCIKTFLNYLLADPNFYSLQEVDEILGCDVFS